MRSSFGSSRYRHRHSTRLTGHSSSTEQARTAETSIKETLEDSGDTAAPAPASRGAEAEAERRQLICDNSLGVVEDECGARTDI